MNNAKRDEDIVDTLLLDRQRQAYDNLFQSLLGEDSVDLMADMVAGFEEIEGDLQGLQEAVLIVLRVRFPVLAATPQAQQVLARIQFQHRENVSLLHEALLLASDERAASILLELLTLRIQLQGANSNTTPQNETYVQLGYKVLIRRMAKRDPVTQQLIAEAEARDDGWDETWQEAWAQGRIKGLQKAVSNILSIRFAVLAATPQVQQAVASIEDAEKLKQLQEALLLASDEQTARIVLDLPSE
ncbi:MAG TPA: hypothetical protein VHV10_14845 [Ktedonobacteraceae bacterium]|jgi:hypothetical protein|nr:hypothetical protein [Ktedonobacteraceae bacterium]